MPTAFRKPCRAIAVFALLLLHVDPAWPLFGKKTKLYVEPDHGPTLRIENQFVSKGLLAQLRVNVCQVMIDGKCVFPKVRKRNIPFGSTYELRISPGTHKFAVYWGGTFPFKSACFDSGEVGEIEIGNSDFHLFLQEGPNIFLNALGSSFGLGTALSGTEVEKRHVNQPGEEPRKTGREQDKQGIGERLRRLKKLYEKDLISEDEYKMMRNKILDDL